MYAANPFRSSSSVSTMYRQVGVASAVDHASPHQLVTMLYDGLLEAIAEASSAIAKGDIEAKGRAIGRAVRIVEEGLRGGLDRQRGGEVAQNLDALYQYLVQQLTKANLRSDTAALAECQRLVKPVRDAWVDIGSAQPQAA
jgi:flagellar protein FliS